ncbi:hypothetical protein BD779DRAFT_1480897 [Infundibulicybe gibba]|nr:hypothetical protein BD779DRAFT_1480897 [Infundibulicybe gibba]
MSDAVSRAKIVLRGLYTQYPKPDAKPSELHEWASVFVPELAAYDSALNGAPRDNEVVGWMIEIRPRMVDALGPNWQAAVQVAPTAGTADTPMEPGVVAEEGASAGRVTRATTAKGKGKERATTAPIRYAGALSPLRLAKRQRTSPPTPTKQPSASARPRARPVTAARRSNRARVMVPVPAPKVRCPDGALARADRRQCDTCAEASDCDWSPRRGRCGKCCDARRACLFGKVNKREEWIEAQRGAQPGQSTTAPPPMEVTVTSDSTPPPPPPVEEVPAAGEGEGPEESDAETNEDGVGVAGVEHRSSDDEETDSDDRVVVKMKPPTAADLARHAKQARRDQVLEDEAVIRTPTPAPSQSDDESTDEEAKKGKGKARGEGGRETRPGAPPVDSGSITDAARDTRMASPPRSGVRGSQGNSARAIPQPMPVAGPSRFPGALGHARPGSGGRRPRADIDQDRRAVQQRIAGYRANIRVLAVTLAMTEQYARELEAEANRTEESEDSE